MKWLAWLVLGVGVLPAAAASIEADSALVPPYEDSPCWVSVFDGRYFQPPSARLTGPTFLEEPKTGAVPALDLRKLGGQDFVDRIDSLIVGPRARVSVYDEENFSGESVAFGPGERVADLGEHGFANRIGSIKVECE